MPRADAHKTVSRTEIGALQQSDFASCSRGMFEIQPPWKTKLVQFALTVYHHQEIQSHLSLAASPADKKNK
ncbi:MAG TPA: hypothetical protein VJS17_12835 [Pyrinomonadaceae bacterium]|nr:hypothetical protein [Pyrinomonadaceae bacterium]